MGAHQVWVAVDIETTGLSFTTDTIRGIGVFGVECGSEFITDVEVARTELHKLRDAGALFVMQNGSFDLKFLRKAGIHIECAFDTMLAAYLLAERPKRLSLDSLASFYLGLPSWKDVDFLTASIEELSQYCLQDCEATLNLRHVLEERLKKEERFAFFEKITKARQLLTDAEYYGMSVDWANLGALNTKLRHEASEILGRLNVLEAEKIRKWQLQEIERKAAKTKDPAKALERYLKAPLPEFNWSSPKQVLWMLKEYGADVMHWNPQKREKVESSCDDVLQKNATKIKFCAELSELRGREKLASALVGYTEIKSPLTGKIHCNFNLHITDTGRLSSSNPNLQNVDRSSRVRSLFIPRSGNKFLVGDLAQIEVRMAAHYSHDPKLIDMFKRGDDFYGTIAVEILNADCTANEVKAKYPALRNVAKTIGLSILYGVGAARLRDGIEKNAGISFSLEASRQFIRQYFERFEGLKDLRIRVEQAVAKKGHLLNLFGRRVDVTPDDVYMHGVNYLLQSSASDLMLFRQIELEEAARKAGIEQQLVSLVHDELIREVRPEQASDFAGIVTRVMENTTDIEFRTPLKIEIAIGDTWGVK